jgi:hypothetical protein
MNSAEEITGDHPVCLIEPYTLPPPFYVILHKRTRQLCVALLFDTAPERVNRDFVQVSRTLVPIIEAGAVSGTEADEPAWSRAVCAAKRG